MDNVIKAIQVRLHDGEARYKQVQFNFAAPLVFPPENDGMGPAVYLASSIDLAFLSDHSGLINCLGNKNKHKGLSHYFLRHTGPEIPLLNCSYSFIGKLKDSLKKYLENCSKLDEPQKAIVLVSADLFSAVWKIAEHAEPLSVHDDTGEFMQPDDLPDTVGRESLLLERLTARVHEPPSLSKKYIGHAESVQLVRKQIVIASRDYDLPVLILGDTGTGKEIVAREIHSLSTRNKLPFKAINCGAISKELLEVELFGCEKDVVGPGYPQRTGMWAAAGKGTLFLDEIGDLSPDHQVKILRALQENSIRRVGGTQEIPVHARIVAASNKDIFGLANSGRFRFDLYYRLNGIPIRTPRLQDHIEDVPGLAQALWIDIVQEQDAYLSSGVLDFLMKYRWPGNVRELRMLLSGLFALYHESRPSVRDVQDAFLLQGLCLHNHTEEEHGEDPIHNHRVKCLQHLKAGHAVFHGLITQLKEFEEDQENGLWKQADSYPPAFSYLVHELSTLCGDNSYYFYSPDLASGCQTLCDKFIDILDERTLHFTEESISNDLKKIMTEVSGTIVSLLQGVNSTDR